MSVWHLQTRRRSQVMTGSASGTRRWTILMGGIKTISRQRVIGEGSGLNVWIEEIEENKLCPSGISKLAAFASYDRRRGHITSARCDVK
jgi:hypothetical protein